MWVLIRRDMNLQNMFSWRNKKNINIFGSKNIAVDKVLFSTKKLLYFSYLSTKTYVVVLIRSASARRF